MIECWKPNKDIYSGGIRISSPGKETASYYTTKNGVYSHTLDTFSRHVCKEYCTPCTASELAAYYSEFPETVKPIWKLVEEHDGCRCYRSGEHVWVCLAKSRIHGHVNRDKFDIIDDGGYPDDDEQTDRPRTSLDEVLVAVKDNAPVTKQILEFVGKRPEPEESPKAEPAAAESEPVAESNSERSTFCCHCIGGVDTRTYQTPPITELEVVAYARGISHALKCDVDIYGVLGTVKYAE